MSVWIRRIAPRTLTLVAFENALIIGAVVLGVWLRLGESGWTRFVLEGGVAKTFLIAIVCQLCFYFADLYDSRATADTREMFTRLVQGLGAASFVLAILYFWFPTLIIGRGVFLIASGLVISVVGGSRMLSDWLVERAGPKERLLVVGAGTQAVRLAKEVSHRRVELGVEIVGFVDDIQHRLEARDGLPGTIGEIDDIPSIARARGVTRVVVSLADARGRLPMDKLLAMKLDGVRFDHMASVYEEYTGKIAVENLRPSWLIFSSGFQKTQKLKASKRAVDVVFSALAMIIGLPILILVAIAVRAMCGSPVLYHQRRVGQNGRLFTVHKFRSMRLDAEAATGAVWATTNDVRVTPIGRFLRRTRLDELPQLWNVFVGEMSLVGPRPERPEFVAELTKQIPFYGERHTIKPGLTGWAQVQYTYGASVEDALEKLQYDLFYIKNLTLALDFLIMFNTVKTVILRRGAA